MQPLRTWKFSLLAAVIAGLLLAGCGRKGPLYLPDEPRPPAKKDSARPFP